MTGPRDDLSGNLLLPQDRSERPYRETAEVAGAVKRLIRTLGKRIAEEDAPDLVLLQAVKAELDAAFRTAIEGIRQSGFSDRDIGEALGKKRQAIQKKWPREPDGGEA